MDTIYIVGAGAIGKALAALLTHHHRKVVLLRARAAQAVPYKETITLEVPEQLPIQATVTVSSLEQVASFEGIVVLTNKSFGNERIAGLLRGKTGHSPIVLLQNGLRVEECFADPAFSEVYRCVLFVTSQFTADGYIRFRPVTTCPVGAVKGEGAQLESVVERLHTPVFPFRAEPDLEPIVWKKAIANCVFNSICPLIEADNGIFHRDQQVLSLATAVVAECVGVARAKGIALTEEEVLESVLLISQRSDGQLISTLQDIRQGRPTEIATLNAAIVGFAEELGLGSQVSATRLLGQLTQLKSDLGR
ncbi:ketopantoate reductase family protein [Paraflavitalea pollutisoli]|uniref:ketopantoate reductase family protein n=1 Tax=Paraflavitalea pollutisoli TaxID=3034143 RepID=UPI0023ED9A0E|nr:2-dehydropantoate 2-reductase [Paraflavitalea sp. H1-2-19X]